MSCAVMLSTLRSRSALSKFSPTFRKITRWRSSRKTSSCSLTQVRSLMTKFRRISSQATSTLVRLPTLALIRWSLRIWLHASATHLWWTFQYSTRAKSTAEWFTLKSRLTNMWRRMSDATKQAASAIQQSSVRIASSAKTAASTHQWLEQTAKSAIMPSSDAPSSGMALKFRIIAW